MIKKTSAVACATVTFVALASPVHADGGNKPSAAPGIALGQAYFGNNSDYGCNNILCRVDMWRLPPLLAQDVVTVAWRHTSTKGPRLCVAGNVDDYNWLQDACNLAEPQYGNDAGKRTTFQVSTAASPAYLQFIDKSCFASCGYYGPYQFTVESIQHALGLGLPSVSNASRKGTVQATASLSNGAPAPDGLDVALIVRKGTKKWVRVARVSGGRLTFALRLPKSARGKVRMSLSRGVDGQYLAASTSKVRVRVL